MSGDATIQAAIQDLIQALARYEDADVVLGDMRVLGRNRQAVVILPGPQEARRSGDWSQVDYVWTHYVEVWRPFQGDDYADIVGDRQAVLDQLAAYPTLDGTAGIAESTVTASDRPQYLWPRGVPRDGMPSHVGFRLMVRTEEWRVYAGAGEFG